MNFKNYQRYILQDLNKSMKQKSSAQTCLCIHTYICQFQNIESLIKSKVILRTVSLRAFFPNPQRCEILSEGEL